MQLQEINQSINGALLDWRGVGSSIPVKEEYAV
jgi:hypothetical protein